MLGWTQGEECQFAAFQAVVADQVGGDTLHHAFSVNGFKNTACVDKSSKSKRLSRMQWMFIDEISQVTAELLHKCELNARCMVQDASTYKINPHTGEIRNWAGINGVCTKLNIIVSHVAWTGLYR